MSELAYNLQGERFHPPATAASWRVRRLKPGGRGTPDVVFSKEGAPLMLPLETELAEFRAAVGGQPGRYRLDPVTENHLPCDGGQPAYLHLDECNEDAANAAPATGSSQGANDDLIRELVRGNIEMVRTMADKFASVMDATAVVLRAADGAGLPSREPMAMPPHVAEAYRNAAALATTEVEDEDDGEEFPTIATVLQTTIDRAMPLVNHAVNTKVLGLSAEQSIALMGGSVGAGTAKAAPTTTTQTKKPDAPSPASPPEAPADAPDFMPHLLAIQSLLTTQEAELARAAVAQMAPAAVAAWREQILSMSPADAAAMIRGEVAKRTADAGSKTKPGSKTEPEKEAA